MNYTRAWYPGDTYFFTVNLVERSCTLLVDHVGHLRETMCKVKQVHLFKKYLVSLRSVHPARATLA